MNDDDKKLQTKIVAEWMAFSRTDAYKDWVQTMDQTMQLIQDNVDNMTESRPVGVGKVDKFPIDAERSALLNQRKVGIKYAMQHPALRIES